MQFSSFLLNYFSYGKKQILIIHFIKIKIKEMHMKGIKAYSIVVLVFPVLIITAIILGIFEGIGISTSKKGSVTTTFGDVKNLQTSYDRWKAKVTQNGEYRNLVLPLGYSKGLSAYFTKAHGRATLDLVDASLSVEISGFLTRNPSMYG